MRVPSTTRLAAHFRRLATMSSLSFIIRLAFESLLVSLIVGLPLMLLPLDDTSTGESDYSFLDLVIGTPFLETLLCQAIPIRLAQIWTRNFKVLVLVGWLPFGALHFLNGAASGIAAGLAGGYYLGFAYAIRARRSHRRAFLETAAIHAIGNFVVWLLLFVPSA
jgi:hypothetical protein